MVSRDEGNLGGKEEKTNFVAYLVAALMSILLM
jgi:hypothetical protein